MAWEEKRSILSLSSSSSEEKGRVLKRRSSRHCGEGELEGERIWRRFIRDWRRRLSKFGVVAVKELMVVDGGGMVIGVLNFDEGFK